MQANPSNLSTLRNSRVYSSGVSVTRCCKSSLRRRQQVPKAGWTIQESLALPIGTLSRYRKGTNRPINDDRDIAKPSGFLLLYRKNIFIRKRSTFGWLENLWLPARLRLDMSAGQLLRDLRSCVHRQGASLSVPYSLTMNSLLAGCGSLIGYREHDGENMDLNLVPVPLCSGWAACGYVILS